MIHPTVQLFRATLIAAVAVASGAALAQDRPPGGLLDNIFGGNSAPAPQRGGSFAQADAAELVVRIDRLENQIRQLTGAVEQLQYRNQQLEQALAGRGAPQATPPVG